MRRAPPAVAAIVALAAGVLGCSGGGTRVTAAAPSAAPTASPSHRTAFPSRCSSSRASSPYLTGVRTAMLGLPGSPDGVATTPDGRWSFVSLQGSSGRIAVSASRSFPPRLVRTLRLPTGDVSGLAVTPDGRLLLGASGRGAVVVSVAAATRGGSGVLRAVLRTPARGAGAGGGAAEVAVSPDSRFAFVSLEGAGAIAVFGLHPTGAGRFVGTIPVGRGPLGVAISPDGRRLYATSELAHDPPAGSDGSLTVIDRHRAETDPRRAVLASAPVPCHPVRVAVSPDGQVVWVSARTGNELFAFAAAPLAGGSRQALIAAVRVGEQPIGLAVLDSGRRVIVADSNLLGRRGATAGLSLIDTSAAESGRPAVLGVIRTGRVPSELAVGSGGHALLVNNSGSDQLEAVDLTRLP